ncbi:Type IV leader peptidase family protein [Poriferisphaera corsica]|uniref:Type IV leader peptidase family protein n=1 Tax=Poriferisphaera corsica TaxID=2528020 RepID=A0A517YUY5_9BACT|nr:A24 family peptidase [Poriferisphaera corsica]QDU34034.1 Type IV leader peptidase family protein [Poriferisphaera corsica]
MPYVSAIAFIALITLVVISAITDIREGLVYNRVTYSAIVLGFMFWAIAGWMDYGTGLKAATLGFSAGLLPYALMFFLGGLGGGDVKLMAAVGTISASWQCVLSTTVYALIIAMLFCIFVMFRKKIIWQTLSKILVAFLSVRAGTKHRFENAGAQIPFAAAVAVGATLAGAEQLLGLTTPWSWLNP